MNAQEALVEALVEAGKPLHRVSLDLDGNETPWAAAIIKALPKGWGVKEDCVTWRAAHDHGVQQERERLRAEVKQDEPHFDPDTTDYARQLLADPDDITELAAERRFANQRLNPDPVTALAKTPPPEAVDAALKALDDE